MSGGQAQKRATVKTMTDSELNALSALVHAHCVDTLAAAQDKEHKSGYHPYKDDGEGKAVFEELVKRGVLKGGGIVVDGHTPPVDLTVPRGVPVSLFEPPVGGLDTTPYNRAMGNREIADIILNGQPRIQTAWGVKTLAGLADMISLLDKRYCKW